MIVKIETKLNIYVASILLSITFCNAQIGIGTTTPKISSQLDVTSSNKGFLPPRMTATQRNAIIDPAFGLIIYCTDCGPNGELEVFNGTNWVNIIGNTAAPKNWSDNYVHCNLTNPTTIVNITNPTTGKTWMDRNLGANRVAISSTDTESYGSLFQWGRFADGHQCINRFAGDGVTTSSSTTTLSTTNTPGHGNFISNFTPTLSGDWRNPQNTNLWQGVNGINNPCPNGYRVPTDAEWNSEIASWTVQNSVGAFSSSLKLPLAGGRDESGTISWANTTGEYWSRNVLNTLSVHLMFRIEDAGMNTIGRAFAKSIRCIKN